MMAVVTLDACAGAERPLLERFFGASRLRDRTALQSLSTITFEPREQGIVRTFEITDVTRERLEGGTFVKAVTVAAPVVLPDGRTVPKTLVVTMQRAMRGTSGVDRWIITGIADAGATPARPGGS
jgi:hypothetical protein